MGVLYPGTSILNVFNLKNNIEKVNVLFDFLVVYDRFINDLRIAENVLRRGLYKVYLQKHIKKI